MLVLGLRLFLSVIFVLAAVGKLLDLQGSREAMRGFGLPDRLAGPAGTALPFVELALALLLLPGETAWFGALGVFVLLILFIAGISYNLLRGRRPGCHCFGQFHSAPIGKRTLARNTIMALLAAFIVVLGPAQASMSLSEGRLVGWVILRQIEISLLVLSGALLIAPYFLLRRMRSRRASAKVDNGPVGLEPGTAAPAFMLPDLEGQTVTLEALLTEGKPLLLLFTDPACKPCREVYPKISGWQRDYGEGLNISLISRGKAIHNQQIRADYDLPPILLQQDREVAERYRAYGTPGAVLILAEGIIGSYVERGAEAIGHLLSQIDATVLR